MDSGKIVQGNDYENVVRTRKHKILQMYSLYIGQSYQAN
jgi:hypothetical protein